MTVDEIIDKIVDIQQELDINMEMDHLSPDERVILEGFKEVLQHELDSRQYDLKWPHYFD